MKAFLEVIGWGLYASLFFLTYMLDLQLYDMLSFLSLLLAMLYYRSDVKRYAVVMFRLVRIHLFQIRRRCAGAGWSFGSLTGKFIYNAK